jgi:hypothetical protein
MRDFFLPHTLQVFCQRPILRGSSVQDPQAPLGIAILRVDPDCRPVVLPCLVVAAKPVFGHSAIAAGLMVKGIEPDRPGTVGQGALQVNSVA